MEVFDVARTGHQRPHNNGWRNKHPTLRLCHQPTTWKTLASYQVLAHKPSACSFAHGQLIAWRKMHSVFMSPQQSSLIFLATKEGVQSIMCVVVVIHTSQQSQRQQSILAVAIMQGLEHTCRSMNTQYFHISQLWRLLVLLRLTL